jgi:hypothetical protein
LNWISIGSTNDGTEFIRTQRRRIRSPKNANQMKDEDWAFIFVYLYYIFLYSVSFIYSSPLASCLPASKKFDPTRHQSAGRKVDRSQFSEGGTFSSFCKILLFTMKLLSFSFFLQMSRYCGKVFFLFFPRQEYYIEHNNEEKRHFEVLYILYWNLLMS